MNNLTVLLLQYASEFAIMRARARPHTLASFPLTKSGGKDARVVWVVEYMYICDRCHSVADSVSAPVAGSDPTPRSASLRFGVGSLNPGSNHARRKRRGAFAPAVSA